MELILLARVAQAKVLKDFAIDPLRQCVTVSIPEVEVSRSTIQMQRLHFGLCSPNCPNTTQGMCSEREQFAKDCGSYKRRLAKLEVRRR